MKPSAPAILIFASLIAACAPQSRTPEVPPTSAGTSERIIGGEDLKTGDPRASYVVMLRTIKHGRLEICTGTFVSESAILTAGHCVGDDIARTAVIYALKPFVQEEVVELPIIEVVRSSKDLAIVFFSGGLPASARVADFGGSDSAIANRPLFVLGYGRTEGHDDPSEGLREEGILRGVRLSLELLSLKDETIEARQDGGRGVCFGDSGGPALVETDAKTYVVGVVSGGGNALRSGIDQCLLPSRFMRVSFFRSWMERVLGSKRTPGPKSQGAGASLVSFSR